MQTMSLSGIPRILLTTEAVLLREPLFICPKLPPDRFFSILQEEYYAAKKIICLPI